MVLVSRVRTSSTIYVEEALTLVLLGRDSDFSLSELSSDISLLSSSERGLNLDELASEDEGGDSDGVKNADLSEARGDSNDAGDDNDC